MRLRQQFLTRNDCYQTQRTIRVKGVMVHSTGADNPRVCRYVPGDAEIGFNAGGNHWDRSGLAKCVHAFVGKFADGEVGTVQTLPWDRRGWHAGGAANNTHIGFEICEDGLTDPVYFAEVYREAAELTAMLCKRYGLDPLADGVVICHQEGCQRGVASNHADVLHWFPKMGRSMDDFRAEVVRLMKEEDRKSTRLNSSHANISYAVFCLKKKTWLLRSVFSSCCLARDFGLLPGWDTALPWSSAVLDW